MARILFTWELGSGYGHVFRMLPLAIELKKRGHNVVFILRNLEQIEQHIGSHDFTIFQAPLWQVPAVGMPPIASYADILLRYGYYDQKCLLGLVKSWRNYFQLIKPDLLVFDFSPTALLASHGSDIPRINYGNGFEIPPLQSTLPSIRWWDKIPEKIIVDHEQIALQTINDVLKENKQAPLSILAQLFKVNDTFLATFKELDHYPSRLNAEYCGIPINNQSSVPPHWPLSRGKKVFVYLNQDYHGLNDLVNALNSLSCCTLIHSPGLSPARITQLQSASINISSLPIDIDIVRQECDLAICHSGVGTGTSVLLAGHPVMLIPLHIEQYSVAKSIVELGAGILIEPKHKKVKFKKLLKELLETQKYSQSALAFSEKYQGFDSQEMIVSLANRCEKQLK